MPSENMTEEQMKAYMEKEFSFDEKGNIDDLPKEY